MQWEVRRSKKYRDRAEECRRLAEIATDDDLKASYQALAKSYDTLANQTEALELIDAPLERKEAASVVESLEAAENRKDEAA
jgi:hypothetical protein